MNTDMLIRRDVALYGRLIWRFDLLYFRLKFRIKIKQQTKTIDNGQEIVSVANFIFISVHYKNSLSFTLHQKRKRQTVSVYMILNMQFEFQIMKATCLFSN